MHQKVLLDHLPFSGGEPRNWMERGKWPASWITVQNPSSCSLSAYRRTFNQPAAGQVRLHITASERYQLFFDGEVIGEGPERGQPSQWPFDTYDLDLSPGDHCLVLLVWDMGVAAPRWQLSLGQGALVASDEAFQAGQFNTGVAHWEGMSIDALSFERPHEHDYFSTGWNMVLNGDKFPWGFEQGTGEWGDVCTGPVGSSAGIRTRAPEVEALLRPATVPGMCRIRFTGMQVRHVDQLPAGSPVQAKNCLEDELVAWQRAFDGGQVHVRANRRLRVLVDSHDYVVGRLSLQTSGGSGARIRVRWAEALTDSDDQKGHRDAIEGRFFRGVGDDFLIDGGPSRHYELPMLIRAGRYLLLEIETRNDELTLDETIINEIRYPLRVSGAYSTDDQRFNQLLARCERTLDVSSQDVFTDGPYWEQMMWAGDGIQSALTTYVRAHDDTLIKRWLTLLDQSRDASGLPCARWPARDRLLIGGYALYWVQGLRDFMMWRNDLAFVRTIMPGVRAALDAIERSTTPQGLLGPLPGWSFVDWVPGWEGGIPHGAETDPHTVLNWHWIMALGHAAEIEFVLGEKERAARYRRLARAVSERLLATRWDHHRGVFVDTDKYPTVSEHAQVFAVLSGQLSLSQMDRVRMGLAGEPDYRATPQFGHHSIEALRKLGSDDQVWSMLRAWEPVLDQGFHTLPETPEPTRSDCHAWSAHPRFHVAATVAGVRPASPGFGTVAITPNVGPLTEVQVTVPHPDGEIQIELQRRGQRLHGLVSLPQGVTGQLALGDDRFPLVPGSQKISGTSTHASLR